VGERQYIEAMQTALRTLWSQRPGLCPVCGLWVAGWACEPCLTRFAPPTKRCPRCACHWGDGLCPDCRQHPPVLSACHAALDYAYPWDGLIARWKFHGELGLNSAWHGLLRDLPLTLDDIEAILPIPLSTGRLAERGYNQAWELAKGLLQGDHRHKGLPQALVRLAEVPDQHRLSAAERRVNLRGVFGVHPEAVARVHNARLLLVDDVMTTGATLSEAATTLLNAGARSVSAVVLARTPPA